MNELKPCPFCGSAEIEQIPWRYSTGRHIQCKKCLANVPCDSTDSKELAFKWNQRVSDSYKLNTPENPDSCDWEHIAESYRKYGNEATARAEALEERLKRVEEALEAGIQAHTWIWAHSSMQYALKILRGEL